MTPIVVDTDVVSFLFKNDSRVQLYLTGFVSVPSSRDLVIKWAEVMVAARTGGHRIDAPDAWIAATALLYGAYPI
jgi:predicted nucleic acid-binding protein